VTVPFGVCQDDSTFAALVSLPDPELILTAVCPSERAGSESPFAAGGACARESQVTTIGRGDFDA
jgi:hypothetical protein